MVSMSNITLYSEFRLGMSLLQKLLADQRQFKNTILQCRSRILASPKECKCQCLRVENCGINIIRVLVAEIENCR